MSGVQQVPVAAEADGQRLDRWFKQHFPQVTHGRLEKMLRKGEIRVDGRRVKASARLESGQVVRVPPLPPAEAVAAERASPPPVSAEEAASLQAAVLYKDENVIAIDKPAGLAVQGGSGQRRHLDGMLDALRFGAAERPRLVHRLDRDTAGVLLLARNAPAARSLTAAFRGKDTQKVYWALVAGEPAERRGLIDLPLAKQARGTGASGGHGEAVAPDEAEGKDARTLFQVVQSHRARKSGEKVTWLVLLPLTGRTHQLRVHCAAMGTPIVGDGKYGGRGAFPESLSGAKTLHLLARELALPDPEDGTTLRVAAPLPPHMAATWKALGFTEAKGEGALQALLAYAEGLSHSPAKGQRPL